MTTMESDYCYITLVLYRPLVPLYSLMVKTQTIPGETEKIRDPFSL